MKFLVSLALAVSAALCLSGCAINAETITSSAALVNSLASAGCKGTVHIAAGATTAAAGVPSANISNSFDGTCDPSTVGVKATAALPPS